jgi:hypothetical protein
MRKITKNYEKCGRVRRAKLFMKIFLESSREKCEDIFRTRKNNLKIEKRG